MPALAHLEKRNERHHIRLVGPYIDKIQIDQLKTALEPGRILFSFRGELFAKRPRRRIHQYYLAGFGVFQFNKTDIVKSGFAWISNLDRDNIVFLVCDLERTVKSARHEIGQQEDHRLALDHLVHILKRSADISSDTFGLKIEHFPDQPKNMRPPLFGRDIQFYRIGENDQPDFVVILNRRKGQHCAEFGGGVRLEPAARAESTRRGCVDQNDD